MTVENILYQLLLEHECVILPNFGGFIVRESPCNYNSAKEIIKPFSKSIFFNQHLTENDGLLINAISRIKNLSYIESTKEVESWIKQLSEQIENNSKLNIPNIGNFTKGTDGNKWFAADPMLNLSLLTYGLKPVKASVVSESILKVAEPEFEIKPLADNKPIETFAVTRSNWKAWTAAAAIALLAHVGYLTIEGFQTKNSNQAAVVTLPAVPETINVVESTIEEDTVLLIPKTEIENIAEVTVPETEKPLSSEMTEIKTEEPTPIVTEATITDAPVIESSPIIEANSETVVGKYKLEINALNHVKDLSKNGIIGRIEINAQGLYDVKIPLVK